MHSRRRIGIHTAGFLVVLLVMSACAAEELTRGRAKEIIEAQLSSEAPLTRDVPVGKGLHMATDKAMDFGAPIRLDMFHVYQELQRQGLITMTDRGGLQGFAGRVRTYDVDLTPEGKQALGEVHQGKPDYGRGASAYPIPSSYVKILVCRKEVREITGIRIVTPDVVADVEFSWRCAESSPLADLVASAKKEYPRDPGPPPSEGTGSLRLSLYDDGWRVAEGK